MQRGCIENLISLRQTEKYARPGWLAGRELAIPVLPQTPDKFRIHRVRRPPTDSTEKKNDPEGGKALAPWKEPGNSLSPVASRNKTLPNEDDNAAANIFRVHCRHLSSEK
ncbi:hypothetical protein K0M31_001287 [Melipona bicolor]|uniref:Uncharacterized protein n=1 Tax=Melipona bicolor TaxID=60889 RepID=A0AA40GG48_9HYME|nr:hypothetical protein K0M31_001287 [Melipona bicolor]